MGNELNGIFGQDDRGERNGSRGDRPKKSKRFLSVPHQIILNSVRSSGFGYFQHNHIRGPKNVTDQGAQGYSAEPVKRTLILGRLVASRREDDTLRVGFTFWVIYIYLCY